MATQSCPGVTAAAPGGQGQGQSTASSLQGFASKCGILVAPGDTQGAVTLSTESSRRGSADPIQPFQALPTSLSRICQDTDHRAGTGITASNFGKTLRAVTSSPGSVRSHPIPKNPDPRRQAALPPPPGWVIPLLLSLELSSVFQNTLGRGAAPSPPMSHLLPASIRNC